MTPSRFRVFWADSAVRDLEEIVSWVAKDSVQNARKLHVRLRKRVKPLRTTPLSGRVVPELAETGIREFRELFERPYRVVYRVLSRRVVVMAVLDGRRSLEDELFDRLVRS